MKNKYISYLALSLALLMTGSLLFTSCSKDKAWTVDNDIAWPTPSISAISKTTEEIDKEITLTGSFYKIREVSIDGVAFGLKDSANDKTVNSLVVKVPRNLGISGGRIKVVNVYKKYAVYSNTFIPTFPSTKITKAPTYFYIDGDIVLEGANMDLITSLKVGSVVFTFDGTSSTTSLTIKTKGKLDVKDGDILKISNIKTKGTFDNASSIDLSALTLLAKPKPLEAVGSKALMLFDFEDGNEHWSQWSGSPVFTNGKDQVEHGINLVSLTPHIYGGSKYESVKVSNVQTKDYFAEIFYDKAVDLSSFRNPYLSFLLNTGSGAAHFWLEVYQAGKFGGDVDVKTDGKWVWVSFDISKAAKWGWVEKAHDLDYSLIEYIKVGMKTTITGSTDFVANIDNVQITEGPMVNPSVDPTYTPVAVLKDFEDGVSGFNTGWKPDGGWEDNGKGTPTINGGGLTAPQGSKYLEMSMEVFKTGWSWNGDINITVNKDFALNSTLYLGFWCNTLGNTVTFESELGCNNGKWGTNFTAKTNGWEYVSIPLWVGWSNWGTGAGTYPDISRVNYIKLGMNQNGQAVGTYKFYIDNIMITNGPISLK